jgi:hypothetical protein
VAGSTLPTAATTVRSSAARPVDPDVTALQSATAASVNGPPTPPGRELCELLATSGTRLACSDEDVARSIGDGSTKRTGTPSRLLVRVTGCSDG